MREIQTIQIWKNGAQQNANFIKIAIIYDDLLSSATFYYVLYNSNNEELSNGNEGMDGTDYENWNGSNNDAYTYVCNKLNITLV